MDFVERMDESGKAAWIILMVLGFVFFWPIGLAVLFYLLWSGRMGHSRYAGYSCWYTDADEAGESSETWSESKHRFKKRVKRRIKGRFRDWHDHHHHHRQGSSGNSAFDSYREETLRRLEEEQDEFENFLDRLRQAKDKQEFDQFMKEQTDRPNTSPDAPEDGAAAV